MMRVDDLRAFAHGLGDGSSRRERQARSHRGEHAKDLSPRNALFLRAILLHAFLLHTSGEVHRPVLVNAM